MNTIRMACIALIFAFFCATACNKSISRDANSTPLCIVEDIESNKNKNWDVKEIKEYNFQSKQVYAYLPDSTVIVGGTTRVVNSSCDVVCFIGGTGVLNGDQCNGESFLQKATFVRVIWKKP